MRIAIVFAVLALSGCAVETSEPVDENAGATNEAAAKTNPCSLVRCAAGTHCEVKKGHAACVPDAPSCVTDADCRLFDNYCDGCACDALTTSAPNPVCTGTIVACFVQPCRDKTAACVGGACVVR